MTFQKLISGTALACALLVAGAASAEVQVVASSGGLPEEFAAALERAARRAARIDAIAVSNSGEWVVVSDRSVDASPGVPPAARSAIEAAQRQGQRVEAVAMEGARWAVVTPGSMVGDGVAPEAERAVREIHARRQPVTSLVLVPGPGGQWALTGAGNIFHSAGLPAGLTDAVEAARRGQRPITGVAVGGGGSWVLVAGGWFASGGVPAELRAGLEALRTGEGRSLDAIELRHNQGWAVASNGPRPAGAGADQIEEQLGAARESIYQRMEALQITGLSLAWIERDDVAWTRSWGVRDADDPQSDVYPWTVFEAASVAKPVTSAAALLATSGSSLGLAENLAETGLRSVPDLFGARRPSFDRRPGEAVNLYRLLSHCAGLRFAKQAADEDETGVQSFEATERLPNLTQLLMGEGPASPDYRVMTVDPPGARAVYSGVNHTVVQALLEERAPGGFLGQTRRLLDAAGMSNSGFEQPMPERVAREAAYGHRRGRKLPHQARPAAGSAGLWSTAEDLGRFVAMLNQRGQADRRAVLPPMLVDAMLARDPAVNSLCADRRVDGATMGLGIFVDRPGSRDEVFWHRGTHAGYRAYVVGWPGRRQGLAVMMSAGAQDANAFSRELFDRRAAVYRLPPLPD